jgi:hypothetical protein
MGDWTQIDMSLVKMGLWRSAAKRFPAPLTAYQRWLISLSAILVERTPGHSHTTLYPLRRIDTAICRAALNES